MTTGSSLGARLIPNKLDGQEAPANRDQEVGGQVDPPPGNQRQDRHHSGGYQQHGDVAVPSRGAPQLERVGDQCEGGGGDGDGARTSPRTASGYRLTLRE
jgi:hypothetical protein